MIAVIVMLVGFAVFVAANIIFRRMIDQVNVVSASDDQIEYFRLTTRKWFDLFDRHEQSYAESNLRALFWICFVSSAPVFFCGLMMLGSP